MYAIGKIGRKEAVSQDDQTIRRQQNNFPCSADLEQGWLPYPPIDTQSATYIQVLRQYCMLQVFVVLELARNALRRRPGIWCRETGSAIIAAYR